MHQIRIVTRDAPGQLATIAALLAAASINIEDIDGEEGDGVGVIDLVVRDLDRALAVLRGAGFDAIAQDALVLRLDDAPGALAVVAARLRDAGLNVRSLHIVQRAEGSCLVSAVTSDNDRARAVLADLLVGGDG